MNKWRLLVGVVSMAQLLWGIIEFVEYGRSVGAASEPTGAWVYSGLGVCGLLVLAMPRCGIPVAVVQSLAAGYALCWLPFAITCLRIPPGLIPVPISHSVAMLILMTAGATALLCLFSAVGTWQDARLTKADRGGM